jgi:hypothetical protein
VILLQVGSVELGGHKVTFHGHYQGPTLNHYYGAGLFGRPSARPNHLIDLHVYMTRKYLSIFELIRAYLRYLKKVFKEYVQYV